MNSVDVSNETAIMNLDQNDIGFGDLFGAVNGGLGQREPAVLKLSWCAAVTRPMPHLNEGRLLGTDELL
jgi:hypothetical protein